MLTVILSISNHPFGSKKHHISFARDTSLSYDPGRHTLMAIICVGLWLSFWAATRWGCMYIAEDISADTEVISQGSNGVVEHLVLYIKKYNLIAVPVYKPPHAQFSQFSPVFRKIKQMRYPSPSI